MNVKEMYRLYKKGTELFMLESKEFAEISARCDAEILVKYTELTGLVSDKETVFIWFVNNNEKALSGIVKSYYKEVNELWEYFERIYQEYKKFILGE